MRKTIYADLNAAIDAHRNQAMFNVLDNHADRRQWIDPLMTTQNTARAENKGLQRDSVK
ncbi:MAG: hypothetical protein LAO76_04145 [Acidobacteriia bacterium]|nr:hypothetical protein [Terriglobia bacterium]